jgi:hypothetical protein
MKTKSNVCRIDEFTKEYTNVRGLYASILFMILSILLGELYGQGPGKAYYYYSEVELSWASCNIYFDGGSQMKIPFLPVICYKIAPMGTDRYSRDINVSAPVVFIGNGLSGEDYDCYKDLDVKDKFVLFFYDFPDTVHADLEAGTSLVKRIDDAFQKHVAGIVLISLEDPNPFLVYDKLDFDSIPEIPVISINMGTAEKILMSSRIKPDEMFEKWKKGKFTSRELICKMSLKMEGDFDRIETNDFEFCFRGDYISRDEMEEIIKVNQESVDFILELFKEAGLDWKKIFSCYFRDYDVKLFYTHHWGRGFSSARLGNFYVHDREIPDYGLAVHENTHTLIYQNWGVSESFFDEGIAMYAEAKAEDKDQNHNKVIQFLKEGEMVHLDEMLDFNIGSGEKQTRIGYPASGSFIHFLVESYGLSKLRNMYGGNQDEKQKNIHYVLENIFKKTPEQLEEEWMKWLQKKFGFDKQLITEHFSK